jgi:hypothetical protein
MQHEHIFKTAAAIPGEKIYKQSFSGEFQPTAG